MWKKDKRITCEINVHLVCKLSKVWSLFKVKYKCIKTILLMVLHCIVCQPCCSYRYRCFCGRTNLFTPDRKILVKTQNQKHWVNMYNTNMKTPDQSQSMTTYKIFIVKFENVHYSQVFLSLMISLTVLSILLYWDLIHQKTAEVSQFVSSLLSFKFFFLLNFSCLPSVFLNNAHILMQDYKLVVAFNSCFNKCFVVYSSKWRSNKVVTPVLISNSLSLKVFFSLTASSPVVSWLSFSPTMTSSCESRTTLLILWSCATPAIFQFPTTSSKSNGIKF